MHQRTWQFKLHDDSCIDGASYFEKRASEVAEAMNCRVVASNVVSIENLRGNVRRIVGTALLENAGNGAIPKARQSPRNVYGRGR